MTPNSASSPRETATTARLPALHLTDGEGVSEVPERYRIRDEGGPTLVCLEAPTLRLRIERGYSVNASSARSAQEGTIFLDGVAKAPPFVDLEKGVLNLDHHEGCVRAFTLSTCEQAFVSVSRGLDLQGREWTVWANDPDLDTVMAIWVLLNHRRIRNGSERMLQRLIPMLRLEGVIDVYGFELRQFTGFPPALQQETSARLDQLRAEEARLREEGRWEETDPLDYTLQQLTLLDRLLYSVEDFEGLEEIEELARAELPEKKLVIACRAGVGIYRVEEQLRQTYGERLGILVLQKDERCYTLRQTNAFSRSDLHRAYERLNLIDPAAGNRRSSERWGGSSDIGGSPRGRGSALSVRQIVEAIRDACTPLGVAQRAGLALTVLVTAAGVYALAALPFLTRLAEHPDTLTTPRAFWFSGALLLLGALALLAALWQGPGTAGLRRPAGWRWLLALPVAVAAGLVGGSWIPATPVSLAAALLLALGAELLFRGVVLGAFLGQIAGHRRTPAVSPTVLSTVIYAPFTALGLVPLSVPEAIADPPLARYTVALIAATLFGLATGWARERSESLAPPLLFHLVTVLVALLLL